MRYAQPWAGVKLTAKRASNLRQKILAFVGALIVISLLGSTVSLYRITEVNRLLDTINRVSVPLGRLFTQIQSDGDVFKRELDRGLGISHWKDPHFRPRPMPKWIEDVLVSEVDRTRSLIRTDLNWTTPESRDRWVTWADTVSQELSDLNFQAGRLYTALDQHDEASASQIYPRWNAGLEDWQREIQWGASEYERSLRQSFTLAESRVAELRTGLETVLVVVVALSLLLLWLGERALRPLSELTSLARDITRRGLRKEDKAILPEISLSRTDEVSQLAREFHRMATALLEREKIVDSQKYKLTEQNKLLRDIGELNENILNSIESVLIVVDLQGVITQCNPVAANWLGKTREEIVGSHLKMFPKLRSFLKDLPHESVRLEPSLIEGRVYGGHLMTLRHDQGDAYGSIIVLEDLTDETNLQERLRRAENLAAVGRMSAQVAHEVRNPLHSIGLEAEVAVEVASKLGNPLLRQSLASILASVDRLEKITENYLKLSRMSSGEKKVVDLGLVLESVLATYAQACEAARVRVDWTREQRAQLGVLGDYDLLEQVLGNLLNNSLQALEGVEHPEVHFALGNTEAGGVWIRLRDNGVGIAPEIREKLFTPFVTTRAQGTGLGLSFVKKVIEDHGGQVRALDTLVGASFEMILPLANLEPRVNRENQTGVENRV